MHLHYQQHLNKHFCDCGYSSASYNSIYQHQHYGHCKEPSSIIYEVDRRSYPRFLRHIKRKSAQPFGECTPTLDNEGRHKLTYQTGEEKSTHSREARRTLGSAKSARSTSSSQRRATTARATGNMAR